MSLIIYSVQSKLVQRGGGWARRRVPPAPESLTTYYTRTSGSPKRRHEPLVDAVGDGLVEDAGEGSSPCRTEVSGPRLQRRAQAESARCRSAARSATACSSHVALAPSLPNSSITNGTNRPPSARTRDCTAGLVGLDALDRGARHACFVARYDDSWSRAMRTSIARKTPGDCSTGYKSRF